MAAEKSSAWNDMLRNASRMRQAQRSDVDAPIPGFFRDRVSKPEPNTDSFSAVPRSSQMDPTKPQQISNEFIRAITLQEEDQENFPPQRALSLHIPFQEKRPGFSVDLSEGISFRMNKFSLFALIMGLLLLGLVFFAGGIMLALSFTSKEPSSSPASYEASAPHRGYNNQAAEKAAGELIQVLPSSMQSKLSKAEDIAAATNTVYTQPQPLSPTPLPSQQPGAQTTGILPPPAPLAAPVQSAPIPAGAHLPVYNQLQTGVSGPMPPPQQQPAPYATTPSNSPPAFPPSMGASVMMPPPAPLQAPQPPASQRTQQPALLPPKAETKPLDVTLLSRPYSLQIGNYTTLEEAKKTSHLLSKEGYRPHVVSLHMPQEKKVFSVRMGGYFNRQTALEAATYLKKKETFKQIDVAKNNAELIVL